MNHATRNERAAHEPLKLFHIGILFFVVGSTSFLHSFLYDAQMTAEREEASIVTQEVLECLHNRSSPPPKVVFMVIDAWRFDFLASPDSPMSFLRSQIEQGKAALFKTIVDTPTVTMPRIKALVGGVNPSFISLISNFFANEWVGDSWVRQGQLHKKTMRFYGDDTWLGLFPGVFDQAEGVTSFFVKDYTEVDNNVTAHLKHQLPKSDWDVLILHYLGLDHIGHSLGGDSSQIPIKLTEMDRIAERISTEAKSPVVLFVVGDHGMTKAGSHGGSDFSETRVPLVLIDSRATVKQVPSDPFEPSEIRQIDVANAVSHFLRIPLPKTSIGASILPLLQKLWKVDDVDVDSDFARHLDLWRHRAETNERVTFLVEKYFSGEKLDCRYLRNMGSAVIGELHDLVRSLQGEMLANSNTVWNVEALAGVAALVVGCLCILIFSLRPFSSLLRTPSSSLLILPVVACFASSFVEEEHDIWYYIASTALGSVFLLEIVSRRWNSSLLCESLVILVLHRIATSVSSGNRRRWVMDAELLPPPFIEDGWASIEDLGRRIQEVLSPKQPSSLLLLAVSFYFSRRVKHPTPSSPQRSLPYSTFLPLLLVFKAVAIAFSVDKATDFLSSLIMVASLPASVVCPSAIVFYFCSLVQPQNLLIIAMSSEIGLRCRRLKSPDLPVLTLLGSAFFIMGNSNQISGIDISVGYTGLSFYQPLIVGAQIGLNMYAAQIMLLFAYKSPLDPEFAPLIRSLVSLRVIISTASILALCAFSSHLFVWSVFAPKVLFEIAHVSILLLIYFGSFVYREMLRYVYQPV